MWNYDCAACAAQGQCPEIDSSADVDCDECANDYSDVELDYNLQEPSPCIDGGTADLSQFGIENISNANYSGLAPDMGAFEMECTYYDECGVCDGLGLIFECGCSDPEEGYNCEGECIGEIDCVGVCGGDCSECNECGDCLDNAVECYTVEVIEGNYAFEVSWELNPSDLQGGSPYLEECVYLESGDYTLIMYDGFGDGWNGNEWSISDQDGNLIQSCTLSSGVEGECSFTLEGVEVPECTSLPGDINQDGALDVLDIVMIMGFILGTEVPDETQSSLADMNGDGLLNVLDVVMMVDIVLGGGLSRGATADEASFYYGNDFVSYKSDGNIAGIQFEVTGEYEITDNSQPSGRKLSVISYSPVTSNWIPAILPSDL
jgi:hypothetical protein